MSEDENLLKQVKDGATVISEVIKAAGDNQNVKEAGNELGKTALTVTQTVNNILLPLAAVNFAFDKAKLYFSEKFQEDLSNKTKDIPEERLIEPKASIAGPTLQGLAFSHEEDNLKEMYLNLLKSSMDSETAESAHPAFVELIKQLTSEEAKILNLLIVQNGVPIVEVRIHDLKTKAYRTMHTNILEISDSSSSEPVLVPSLPAYVDNWVRLGLFTVDYDAYLSGSNAYEWVEERPEVKETKLTFANSSNKVQIAKGRFMRTSFGKLFAQATGASL